MLSEKYWNCGTSRKISYNSLFSFSHAEIDSITSISVEPCVCIQSLNQSINRNLFSLNDLQNISRYKIALNNNIKKIE